MPLRYPLFLLCRPPSTEVCPYCIVLTPFIPPSSRSLSFSLSFSPIMTIARPDGDALPVQVLLEWRDSADTPFSREAGGGVGPTEMAGGSASVQWREELQVRKSQNRKQYSSEIMRTSLPHVLFILHSQAAWFFDL